MTPPFPLTLALSEGGAKGAAHAGVLAVLDEAGLPVSGIAGVSAGAVVGVLYALGWKPPAIRDFAADLHFSDLLEFDPALRGVLTTEKLRLFMHRAVGDRTFADLKLPVMVVVVDLRAGAEVHVTSGRLDEALAATTAMPGIFAPRPVGEHLWVDGGVLNPLPVDVARRLGPRVAAVDVVYHSAPPGAPMRIFEARGPLRSLARLSRQLGLKGLLGIKDMLKNLHQATQLTTRRLSDYHLRMHPPDVLLRPDVSRVGLFAFDLSDVAYQTGEATARAALPQLLALAQRP
jgi:NTE family protein